MGDAAVIDVTGASEQNVDYQVTTGRIVALGDANTAPFRRT